MVRIQYHRALTADEPEIAERFVARIGTLEKIRKEIEGESSSRPDEEVGEEFL
jgi:hypothetical protein